MFFFTYSDYLQIRQLGFQSLQHPHVNHAEGEHYWFVFLWIYPFCNESEFASPSVCVSTLPDNTDNWQKSWHLKGVEIRIRVLCRLKKPRQEWWPSLRYWATATPLFHKLICFLFSANFQHRQSFCTSQVVSSAGFHFGSTKPELLGASIPITAVLADQVHRLLPQYQDGHNHRHHCQDYPHHQHNQTCYSRRPSLDQGVTRVAPPKSQWALDLFLVSLCDRSAWLGWLALKMDLKWLIFIFWLSQMCWQKALTLQ